MNEWISVEDRLPLQDGNYLAYWCDARTSCGFVAEAAFIKDRGFIFVRPTSGVTHWMPLPKPPELASE